MKYLIALFSMILIFARSVNSVSAQNKTVTTNLSWREKGGAGDTIAGTGTNTYSWYSKNYSEFAKMQVKIEKTRGTAAEGTFALQKSMDYGNWVTVQTLTFSSSTVTTARYDITADTNVIRAPYVRVVATGTGSNGTFKYTYHFLNEIK
jgi:hypothetical protein